jgi:tetratricopeptide (TPR) repeat protein
MSKALSREEESLEALVAEVIDDFRQRRRRGERPCVEEYVTRYPRAAGELRRVLATLDLLELPGACVAAPGEQVEELTGTLGDFRILREVGRGGMGVVYEAEQISLGRRVALKVLPFAATLDPRHLQRFHNEARAAAGLHHACIVPVYSVGCERGVHYYAMQFIDGRTLADLIAELRQGPAAEERGRAEPEATVSHVQSPAVLAQTSAVAALSTERTGRDKAYFRTVAELAAQAAEALDYAHERGVVHRDIKPGNLLLDARGGLWVTDFGLAHLQQGEGSLTRTGDLVGTLRYMSPEQALAKRVVIDHPTDVYSLGATLYELLTLRPVCPGRDRQEVLRQVAFEEPVAPRKLDRAVPGELETIVLKALEKSPADRYATAQDLADDLRCFLQDRPIQARRPSLRQVALKWARRRRAVVWATAAVLLLAALLGGVNGLWWLQSRATAQAEARAELDEAGRQLERQQWSEGLAAVGQARAALNRVWAKANLREEVEALGRDLEMVRMLQEAVLRETAVKDGRFDGEAASEAYAEAFAWYGLDVEGLDPEAAARAILLRPIRRQLADALDHWAALRGSLKEKRRLVAVSRLVDPDPWRDRVRDILEGNGTRDLKGLLTTIRASELNPATAVLLSAMTRDTNATERMVEVLLEVRRRYPSDFWVNHQLAEGLTSLGPARQEEAIRYFTVAAALQPDSPGAHLNLGNALGKKGLRNEALAEYGEAIRLQKDYAGAHINLGSVLAEKGQVDEAIAAYREAIRLKKNDPMGHNNLGNVLLTKGQVDEAIAAYRQAIRLKKHFPMGHYNLGAALERKGQVDEAIAAFREAIRLKRDHPKAHNNLGVALEKKGRLDEAIAAYRKAIRLRKDYPGAHFTLGAALEKKGRVDEAIAAYREAIRLRKDDPGAHNNLGNNLLTKGQVDEAIAAFRQAIRLEKNEPGAHYNLGYALFTKGQLDEAIAAYREAIHLRKDYAEAHNRLGVALARKGQVDEAIAAYREAIRLKKDDPEAHNNLGIVLFTKGQVDEAIAAFRQAIRLRKDYPEAHYNLGHTLEKKGRVDEAIAAFRQATRLKKNDPGAHYRLGGVLLTKGQVDEAIAAYREAIRLKKDDPGLHYNLGAALAEKGQDDAAMAAYRQAIRLRKDYPEAHCNLGGILLKKGHFHAAVQALRRGHELGSRAPRWPYPSAQWLREARTLARLDDRLPAFLAGKEQPRDADDSLAIARLCVVFRQRYTAGVRFSAEAFDARPGLAEDLKAGNRYAAACAAVLASCGRGLDAPPDEAARSRLRGQALRWLRADLAAWRESLAKGPAARAAATKHLLHWRQDPDLSSVREQASLARLPRKERRAWQKLWADVADTLAAAGKKDANSRPQTGPGG